MHGNIVSLPDKPEAPAPVKHRTITLTNRAPVKIVEDEWPVISQGLTGDEHPGDLWSWDIAIRVRREKRKELYPGVAGSAPVYNQPKTIIHAHYKSWDESNDSNCQTVRVGRIISERQSASDLWDNILAVGEELRERINTVPMRRHVTHAVDRCFADLPAQEPMI